MSTETKDPQKVVTGPVRLSYANIHEPKANDQNVLMYSTNLLLPDSDAATIALIKAAIEAAKQEGIKTVKEWKGVVPSNYKSPIRIGKTDIKTAGDPVFAGMLFFSCKSKNKPILLKMDGETNADSTDLFSGAWAKASLRFYPYSVKGNNGVGVGLNGLMLVNAKKRGLDDSSLAGGGGSKADFANEAEEQEAGASVTGF